MTTSASETPAFDPNVCIGFGAAEHPFPVDQLGEDWLCPECHRRLNSLMAQRPVVAAATRCPGGDHAPGSAYYTCLYCYGD